MKVALIVDKCAPLFHGGYEVRFFKFAEILSQRHDVRVYTSLRVPRFSTNRVDFRRVSTLAFQPEKTSSRNLVHSALFGLSLASDPFRSWEPDAIITEAIPYLHLPIMSSWVKSRSARLLLSVEEAWIDYQDLSGGTFSRARTQIVRHLLSKGLSWCDLAIATSMNTERSLREGYGVSDVATVPSGIDFEDLLRFQSNSNREAIYDFITVGRLVPVKRTADFVSALARLRDRHAWRGKAVIVGQGPEADRLRNLIGSMGLSRQINLSGFVSEEAKRALLCSSRIYVICSEREGQSLSTLEAMAMSLPVVAARPRSADVAGLSDVIHEAVSGAWYPVGDIDALSTSLMTLISNPELRWRLGRGACGFAQKYDWSSVGARLEACL